MAENRSIVTLLPTPVTHNSSDRGEWVREPARYKLGDVIRPESAVGIYGPCSRCKQNRLLMRGTGTPAGFTGECAVCAAMVDTATARDSAQRRRIAELEAGLRELQGMLFHEDWCDANWKDSDPNVCHCPAADQAALITSLLESR